MKSKLTKFAQVAGIMLAMAFTFSCSSDDGNNNNGGGTSSGGGGGTSSPSGSGPKGAISTEIWTLNSYDSDGKIEETYTYRKGYEYDSNGNIIKEISYEDNDWIVNYYITYEYDSKGNKIKGTSYGKSGISGSTEYEYDSNGNKTKETKYNYNGNITSKYEWEYDSNGNATKEAQYDGSGNIKFRYEYDSDGIVTKFTSYEDDGSIRRTWTQTNEVTYTTINSKKLIATCISERPDGTKTKDEYQYDAKGNETKNTHYLLNKTTGNYEKTSESTSVYTYIN